MSDRPEEDVEAVANAVSVIAVCATVTSIAYFVIVVWWYGYIEAKNAENLAKHETCYERWAYSDAHQVHYLAEDYCGVKE